MAIKEDLWAKLQLLDIDKMSDETRKHIVRWLREQAKVLLNEHHTLDKRYRARYWK